MIRNHLAALTEAPAYGQLDPNRLQLLLGRCDALLCRTDHFREVRDALRSQAFPVRWTGVIILLQWPPQTVTPALRRALSELLLLPDPEEMHARIQTLLDGAQDPEQWRRLALRDQLPPPEPDGDTGTGPTVRPVLLQ